ncbi:MAG TPA: response regulator [Allosphingosinicella sp.]|nr:response regulator [Allosphingosinicella sp.]
MHALIIEDEPIIAMLIEDHLRTLGYTSVDFAVTEAEAVAAAGRRCPDLITSDVRLPEGCGIAAVESICGGGYIPVVFITATAGEVRARLSEAIVVAKPFGPAHLREAVFAARAPAARPSPAPVAQ